MLSERHQSCLRRLSRIEGQVRGISRMIDDGRYCIDILTQVQAVEAALKKVEAEILKDHAEHCVAEAIESGDSNEQRKMFGELVDLLSRYS